MPLKCIFVYIDKNVTETLSFMQIKINQETVSKYMLNQFNTTK